MLDPAAPVLLHPVFAENHPFSFGGSMAAWGCSADLTWVC
jgi:hypothetical protein